MYQALFETLKITLFGQGWERDKPPATSALVEHPLVRRRRSEQKTGKRFRP